MNDSLNISNMPQDLYNTGLGIMAVKTEVFTFHHGSALLDAAATSDSANVLNQPAGSVLLGITLSLDELFVASGLTTMVVTVGDGSDADGMLIAGSMNLRTDSVNTRYQSRGTYWDTSAKGAFWYTSSAKQWLAYATSGVANLSTLTAGQISISFTYMYIP